MTAITWNASPTLYQHCSRPIEIDRHFFKDNLDRGLVVNACPYKASVSKRLHLGTSPVDSKMLWASWEWYSFTKLMGSVVNKGLLE